MKTLILLILLCSPITCFADVITDTLIMEAAGEGLEGMTAVAEVIRTRAKERNLSFEQVCLQKKQFSCWNDLNRAGKWLKTRSKERLEALATQAWVNSATSQKTAFNGLLANHYFNPKLCSPSWAKGKQHINIGNHRFLRT